MAPDTLYVPLRALGLAAMLQAAGIGIFVALFSRNLVTAAGAVRRLGAWLAGAALLMLTVQLALEAARMTGELAGVFDLSLQRIALTSPAAAACGAQVLGLVVITAGLETGGRAMSWVATGGSLLVAASFALTGHTTVHADRRVLAPALVTHTLIAAFWLGAIPALYLATVRETADRAARLIGAFSSVAVWVVPVLAAAGALMALLLVPQLRVFSQPYGWLLLGKITGFAILMALAAANRWRLGPAAALGATRAFRRSLAAECVLIVAVLAATATMTSLYSPEP